MNEPFETRGITIGCVLVLAIWGAFALLAVIACCMWQV